MFRKVRSNALYYYLPVLLDLTHPPYGASSGRLKAGDQVRVVTLPGCPRPNMMGHCHIATPGGEFLGLVCTNSLQPNKTGDSRANT